MFILNYIGKRVITHISPAVVKDFYGYTFIVPSPFDKCRGTITHIYDYNLEMLWLKLDKPQFAANGLRIDGIPIAYEDCEIIEKEEFN